jgi:hypothetical protein
MAIPKVNLRQKKGKKGTSYYIDFTISGKRYHPSVGTNEKTALEICQKKQAQLTLGHFDLAGDSN